MRVLFVTLNVLGDAGANAAELFPRHAALSPAFDRVITADCARQKRFIRDQQFAEFLRLCPESGLRAIVRNALRIARKAKQTQIDVIHVFYRLENVPLIIALRLMLLLTACRAKLLVDHRSVNLARGWRGFWKKCANQAMQPFVHHLAGNPLAVETNYFVTLRPKHIIDLGYDLLPTTPPTAAADPAIWFIGSLKPANRKTGFLIEVFARLARNATSQDRFQIHIAGPARPDQIAALQSNPRITYHGRLPRAELYARLAQHPGIGVAFMNREFHAAAPSLKFCEYAIMRYRILASDTPGLLLQAERMQLPDVTFLGEDAALWADTLLQVARRWRGPMPEWANAQNWSYSHIFTHQVAGLYQRIRRAA